MELGAFFVQLLNALSGASSLFLVGAGLSLIFGVTRIVNFAHGSFYMLGLYAAVWAAEFISKHSENPWLSFWGAVVFAAVVVGLFAALLELAVMRRVYKAPELFQLLATFALVLLIKDLALKLFGAEDILGPKAPGMKGAVEVLGRQVPSYDLFSIVIGPVVLAVLWLALTKTRWGVLIRAATQDREMLGALGVNQRWLFTSVFALGAALAALGGALQMPREPASLGLDLAVIGDAFVVVVVGGMGSIPGVFIASLIIAFVKALCVGLGTVTIGEHSFVVSKLTLVAEFLVMAIVLIWKPNGLLGKPTGVVRNNAEIEDPMRPLSLASKSALGVVFAVLMLLPLAHESFPYSLVIGVEILIAVLFAYSLYFVTGPAGMHSFGHAVYFGLGAYGAALLLKHLAMPMELALVLSPLLAMLAALVFGWFCVRLSGVYLAMLTLAFAQIVWSMVYQWDTLTGGSNGLIGIWPSAWLSDKRAYYWLSLLIVSASVYVMFRMLNSPFGYTLRASRDSPLRAKAIGIREDRWQLLGFLVAGGFAGLAGGLFAFAKGTISPETLAVAKSVDGLVMVLLGGIQSLFGPVIGATVFTWLQDSVMRQTDYWRALLGAIILFLVILFPGGLMKVAKGVSERGRR